MSGLWRAFQDMDEAQPWHRAVIGFLLVVGLLLAGVSE